MAELSESFAAELEGAVRERDRTLVRGLCGALVAYLRTDRRLPNAKATTILDVLRKKRHFDEMAEIADTLLQTGHTAPVIRRQYAQALIERGQLGAAAAMLDGLVRDTRFDLAENAEARGLLGRVYKQIYVTTRGDLGQHSAKVLAQSANAYYGVYREEPGRYSWHGINAAAVLAMAARDKIPVRGFPAADTIAAAVLGNIEQTTRRSKKPVPHWDAATAVEACIALDRPDDALSWLRHYLDAEETDAFELGSTHRQMVDVWGLDETTPPGSLLLPPVRASLLGADGGELELARADLATTGGPLRERETRKQYERVLGKDRYVDLDWYDLGRERCRLVARIGKNVYEGLGTGFLIRGSELHPSLGKRFLLLTNAHVVSPDKEVHEKTSPQPLYPKEAVVTFQARGGTEQVATYKVAEVVWTSPPWVVDATLLRLTGKVEAADYPITTELPAGRDLSDYRVYVVGHPGGGSLALSLHDNLLLDYEVSATSPRRFGPRYIHYRSPTTGGSSGSPLFDPNWALIGFHHAGGREIPRLNKKKGTYDANEGLLIDALRRQIGAARA